MRIPQISLAAMNAVREDATPTREKLRVFHQKQPFVSTAISESLGTGDDGLCVISAMADLYLAIEMQMKADHDKALQNAVASNRINAAMKNKQELDTEWL